MPIFEFRCRACKHRFERLVARNDESVICPECKSRDVTKLFSTFAAKSGDRTIGSSCAGCGGGDCASCAGRR